MKVICRAPFFIFITGLLFLLLLGPAHSLSAGEYPARPIKLIVPFSVGVMPMSSVACSRRAWARS